MRPKAIDWFDRFYLASLGVVIFNGIATLTSSGSPVGADAGAAKWVGVIIGLMLGLGLQGMLWFLVSRKANNVARWVLVAVIGLILVSNILTLPATFAQRGTLVLAGTLVQCLLQAAALVMLLRPDANLWFTHARQPDNQDTSP